LVRGSLRDFTVAAFGSGPRDDGERSAFASVFFFVRSTRLCVSSPELEVEIKSGDRAIDPVMTITAPAIRHRRTIGWHLTGSDERHFETKGLNRAHWDAHRSPATAHRWSKTDPVRRSVDTAL
jgi:hypothetical protein